MCEILKQCLGVYWVLNTHDEARKAEEAKAGKENKGGGGVNCE